MGRTIGDIIGEAGGARGTGSTGRTADISEEELAIFGLTGVEAKIVIGLLELGPTGVSKLSRETGLPHTTIHSAIRRVEDQGLVRRVSSGYRSVWKVVQADKVRKSFGKALESFDEEVDDGAGLKIPQNAEFSTFHGVEDMLKTYHWFFLNNRNKHICSILSPVSCETQYSKSMAETMAQLGELMRQNGVTVEEIQPESIKDLHSSNITQNQAFLDPMRGCIGNVYVVPDELLTHTADIKIVKNTVLIADWKKKSLVLIKNPDTISLFQNMFALLKGVGKESDQEV